MSNKSVKFNNRIYIVIKCIQLLKVLGRIKTKNK